MQTSGRVMTTNDFSIFSQVQVYTVYINVANNLFPRLTSTITLSVSSTDGGDRLTIYNLPDTAYIFDVIPGGSHVYTFSIPSSYIGNVQFGLFSIPTTGLTKFEVNDLSQLIFFSKFASTLL